MRPVNKDKHVHAGKFLRLDAARGFVALYVVLGHSLYEKLGPFEPAIRFGQEAVMAFFIISGFVIKWTTSKIASVTDFRSYFFKRFARIYSIWCPGVLLLVILASMEAGRLALDPPGRFLGNAKMPTAWCCLGPRRKISAKGKSM
jgi:peptidoglycan/LPS O-acetylase OafA/YrhL